MRIGPIEINWSPRTYNRVWHRAPFPARRIQDLSPEELRVELDVIRERLEHGSVLLVIPPHDEFQRVHIVSSTERKYK